MTRLFPLLTLCFLIVYALHQDFWLWQEARPLFLDVLPAGLTYHAAYTLMASILVWVIARVASVRDQEGDEP